MKASAEYGRQNDADYEPAKDGDAYPRMESRNRALSSGATTRLCSRSGLPIYMRASQPLMSTACTRTGRILATTRFSPGWSYCRRSELYLAPTLVANE
jgi:hypothetical protein